MGIAGMGASEAGVNGLQPGRGGNRATCPPRRRQSGDRGLSRLSRSLANLTAPPQQLRQLGEVRRRPRRTLTGEARQQSRCPAECGGVARGGLSARLLRTAIKDRAIVLVAINEFDRIVGLYGEGDVADERPDGKPAFKMCVNAFAVALGIV
jgi:hypothetical protein